MGLMLEAHKAAEAQHKKDRAAQAASNQKHMDDLAKIIPSPTLEEVQAAQKQKTRVNEVTTPPSDPPPPVEWSKRPHGRKTESVVEKAPVVETKVSEPESHTEHHGGSYKTRDAKAKKAE